jgi:hypothetical protein
MLVERLPRAPARSIRRLCMLMSIPLSTALDSENCAVGEFETYDVGGQNSRRPAVCDSDPGVLAAHTHRGEDSS